MSSSRTYSFLHPLGIFLLVIFLLSSPSTFLELECLFRAACVNGGEGAQHFLLVGLTLSFVPGFIHLLRGVFSSHPILTLFSVGLVCVSALL